MKALLHLGMHKTGSTAIQRSLKRFRQDGVYYLDWMSANQSSLFAALFEEDGMTHNAFRNKEIDDEKAEELVARYRGRIIDRLARGEDRIAIMSAERGSGTTPEALVACHDFFAPYCDEIEVVCYVRSPRSFMQSAFQQRVKMGTADFLNTDHWPHYERQFAPMDAAFGRQNVRLIPYYRDRLHGGDVVLDFAHLAGLDLAEGDVVKANESLSAEALSMIYVQRKFGFGRLRKVPKAGRKNNLFVDSLRALGGSKMYFSDALLDGVAQKMAGDCDWITERIGEELTDPAPTAGIEIDSEESLIALGVASAALLPGAPAFDGPEALAAHLDEMLRNMPEPKA